MKYIVLCLPLFLTACISPMMDSSGKIMPIVLQNPEPTVIIDNRTILKSEPKTDVNAPIYVCSIQPFFDIYQSENINRAQAKLAVQKKCLAKNEAMFCAIDDIVCREVK